MFMEKDNRLTIHTPGFLLYFLTLANENKSLNVFEDGLESRDFIHI